MRLHLVLKCSAAGGLGRREQLVELPCEVDFSALCCQAWMDTLANGASGKEGDVLDVDLARDGRVIARCEETVKRLTKQVDSLSDF